MSGEDGTVVVASSAAQIADPMTATPRSAGWATPIVVVATFGDGVGMRNGEHEDDGSRNKIRVSFWSQIRFHESGPIPLTRLIISFADSKAMICLCDMIRSASVGPIHFNDLKATSVHVLMSNDAWLDFMSSFACPFCEFDACDLIFLFWGGECLGFWRRMCGS